MEIFLMFWSIFIGVYARFDTFYFAQNEICEGGSGYTCDGGDFCVHEVELDKSYCCSSNGYPRCWSGPVSDCTDNPASNMAGCNQAGAQWCCWSNAEVCTQIQNQPNICWAEEQNPLVNVSAPMFNATLSSLMRESPGATTLTFNATSLSIAAVQATAGTTPSTTSSTLTPSAASENGQQSPSTSGLTSGAIAGIVVGCIAGTSIVMVIIFLLLRRRSRQKVETPTQHDIQQKKGPVGNGHTYEAGSKPRLEMPANIARELSAEGTVAELPDPAQSAFSK